ncbi:MAG: hypothetical protein MJ168_10780 [Clostridia bacterium]|nr:hypothetical protein [Clostridia bacterium]
MNREIILQSNRLIRNKRPDLNEAKACTATPVGDMLEIVFTSKCCRNDKAGTCVMCDYGYSIKNWSDDEYIESFRDILSWDLQKFKSIHLCANGSIMDEYQISTNLFSKIINELKNCSVSEIGIETHFNTVTEDKLSLIQQVLPNKNIYIEMGLETVNSQCLSSLIMKSIDLDKLDNTITLIKKFGFAVVLNILLGMPFMSPAEQLKDAEKTMLWVLEKNCRAVIFPINIKPFTLLYYMYSLEFYQPVSHWLLIILLKSLPANYLNKITVAYYGNRDESYANIDQHTVFPVCCPICEQSLFEFYHSFNHVYDWNSREKLINKLIQQVSCDCLSKQINELKKQDHTTFLKRIESFTDYLEKAVIKGELN